MRSVFSDSQILKDTPKSFILHYKFHLSKCVSVIKVRVENMNTDSVSCNCMRETINRISAFM